MSFDIVVVARPFWRRTTTTRLAVSLSNSLITASLLIVRSLIDGDGEAAEQIMIDQIRAARSFIVGAILSSPNVQLVNVAGR